MFARGVYEDMFEVGNAGKEAAFARPWHGEDPSTHILGMIDSAKASGSALQKVFAHMAEIHYGPYLRTIPTYNNRVP
jgi:hypothetical protein